MDRHHPYLAPDYPRPSRGRDYSTWIDTKTGERLVLFSRRVHDKFMNNQPHDHLRWDNERRVWVYTGLLLFE